MKKLTVFTTFAKDSELLQDAELGRLFRAMMEYAESGTETKLTGNERFLWNMAKANIDRQREAYAEMCSTNKRIANSRYVTSRNESLAKSTKRNEASEEKEKEKKKEIKNNNPLTPLQGALEEFKSFRKSMKAPLTDLAEKKLTNELQRLAGDNDDLKIKIIDQSIRNGWKGVFPLKNELKRTGYEQHTVSDSNLNHLLVNLDG